MLILTRFEGEDVFVGDDVVVRVIDVRRDGRVRLGFDAPASVRILRREVKERMRGKEKGEKGGAKEGEQEGVA